MVSFGQFSVLAAFFIQRPFSASDTGPSERGLQNCYSSRPPFLTQHPPWTGDMHSFFDDFRRLEDIDIFISKVQSAYPKLVSLKEIGKSWEGRPLRLIEVTDASGSGSTEDRPYVYIQGGIHAREWIATSTVLFIVWQLLNESASNLVIADYLKKYVFSFIAPLNPDGYVYSWQKDRMWRKTRSNHTGRRCSGSGVDANRNWDFKWGVSDSSEYWRRLRDPCSELYIGPRPFSELEVAAVANFLRRRQQRSTERSSAQQLGTVLAGSGYIAAFLDYHSNVQMLLPPWAYAAKLPGAPDGAYIKGLTRNMSEAMRSVNGNVFPAGADLLPADPGTGPDWAYGALGIRATMTVELEGVSFGFCPPRNQIRPIGLEQYTAFVAMTQYLEANGGQPSLQVGLLALRFGQLSSSASSPGQSKLVLLTCALAVLLTVGVLMAVIHRKRQSYRRLCKQDDSDDSVGVTIGTFEVEGRE